MLPILAPPSFANTQLLLVSSIHSPTAVSSVLSRDLDDRVEGCCVVVLISEAGVLRSVAVSWKCHVASMCRWRCDVSSVTAMMYEGTFVGDKDKSQDLDERQRSRSNQKRVSGLSGCSCSFDVWALRRG